MERTSPHFHTNQHMYCVPAWYRQLVASIHWFREPWPGFSQNYANESRLGFGSQSHPLCSPRGCCPDQSMPSTKNSKPARLNSAWRICRQLENRNCLTCRLPIGLLIVHAGLPVICRLLTARANWICWPFRPTTLFIAGMQ